MSASKTVLIYVPKIFPKHEYIPRRIRYSFWFWFSLRRYGYPMVSYQVLAVYYGAAVT